MTLDFYDARGNVTSETRTIQTFAHTTLYAYDSADRLSQITYPSGRIVTYARDGQGRITGVTTKKNAAAVVENVLTGVLWQPMSGLLKSATLGNGLALTESYTLDYELSRLEVKNGLSPVIDLSYARGDALNLTGITDNVTAGDSQTFGYTPANRLGTAASAGTYGNFTWTAACPREGGERCREPDGADAHGAGQREPSLHVPSDE